MNIIKTSLEGVLIIEPKVFKDARGFFMETFHQNRYADAGIVQNFVQDNLSYSVKNTIRGLHYQIRHAQAKLIQVVTGEIFDVVVDIRTGSPTFGQWVGFHLSEHNKRQIFIPAGFAHGFCVFSETVHCLYKCSDYYIPADEGGILWSDPGINIDWPIKGPIISEKDKNYPLLGDLLPGQLPIV
ncbi:MAG: dTDP-4-dehydrorhamnose 3,5-epimerase [Proteobacteria bacterium]|nr:dTDP-4-dehydrorhamnose 3,5-epimerase [Pseudomonadota bacterium]